MHSKGGRLRIRCDLLRRRAAVPVSVVPCIHRLRWPDSVQRSATGVLIISSFFRSRLPPWFARRALPPTRTDVSAHSWCPSRSGHRNDRSHFAEYGTFAGRAQGCSRGTSSVPEPVPSVLIRFVSLLIDARFDKHPQPAGGTMSLKLWCKGTREPGRP